MRKINPLNSKNLIAFLILVQTFTSSRSFAQTPVAANGQLKVSGNKIVNKNNVPISLAGNSLFWSNNGWGGEKFYNASLVNYLSSNWKAGVVRAAMGVDEGGGYLADPAGNKAKVKSVVDAAINAGIYVIIDWHSHHAESYRQEAINFFSEMAATYGNKENVIYELYNEPLAVSWSGTIKPYAEAVIAAIRAKDPDNLIIVGTPNWSQDVDAAAADPITKYANIAYTIHFYAATHKQYLRDKANTAMSKGIALFATEWGTCDASGNGAIDAGSTNEWVSFMKQNNISNCNWAVNDKAEAASIFNPGTSGNGPWSEASLTASGKLVKDIVVNWGGTVDPVCTSIGLPGTIQTEAYCLMSGVQNETTTDTGGGQNVGYLETGDWMSYSVNVPTSGTYTVEYRIASLSGGGAIRLEKQGGATVFGAISVPSTGGWQTWTTISHTIQLSAGTQSIAIAAAKGGFNINWIRFSGDTGNNFNKTVQAEAYDEMSGVKTEATSDAGGGSNVGYIETNDWMKYKGINIPVTGAYLIEARVASPNSNGVLSLDLNAGAIQLGTIAVPNTGGWQAWKTVSKIVNLNAGTFDFGIFASTGGWNINWWKISSASPQRVVSSLDEAKFEVFPNPSAGKIKINSIYYLQGAKVILFDRVGAKVFQSELQAEEIDLTTLKAGVYSLVIQHKGKIYSKQIIKK